MLDLTPSGLYCAAGDFHIDSWRPVERAVITHAHGDHARWGSQAYLGSAEGERVLGTRLGPDARIESVGWGEPRDIGGVQVSLHSAGHILGSAQVRVEHRGEVWVVSGDYKTDVDGTCTPFEPMRCDTFVTESTFGLPIYRWGKTATFRAAGLPVSRKTTAEGLARLDAALDRTGASRLLVLGDLLHAREGRAPEMLRMIADWRERRSSLDVLLVRGNHDRHAGDPPPELRIDCRDGPLVEPPFSFDHYQRPVEGTYLLSGHVHPSVRLAGRGRQRARLPCFWFRPHVAILPAFGGFTGGADVSPTHEDCLFVVADEMVVEIGLQS